MNNTWIKQYATILFVVLAIYFIVNIVGSSETIKQGEFAQLILEMAYEAKKTTGLPASIVAAQCILESGWGEHAIGNNFFGIKSDGTQPYFLARTYEWENGKYVEKMCKFRKYETLLESLIDYGKFIYENPRYWRAIANRSNPVDYINEIQNAGYATCPTYADKVLKIAELCKFLTVAKW